jgi:hypothetical protein
MSYELMYYPDNWLLRSLGTFDSYDEADAALNLLVSKANPAGCVIYDGQEIFVEEELYVKERPKIVFDENLILTPPDGWEL